MLLPPPGHNGRRNLRLFYKHVAAHTPLALATIAEAQFLEAKGFVRQYREHLSDFPTWEAHTHAAEWLVFPENVGRHLSLADVAIRQGELYPVLTNNARQSRHGALVAIGKGPKSEVVSEAVQPDPWGHTRDGTDCHPRSRREHGAHGDGLLPECATD